MSTLPKCGTPGTRSDLAGIRLWVCFPCGCNEGGWWNLGSYRTHRGILRPSSTPLESAEHHSWWSKSLHQKYLSQSLSVTFLTSHWFTGLQLMASNSGISYATANIWKIGSSPLPKSVTDQEEPSSSPGVQPHVGAGSWSLSWTEPGQGQQWTCHGNSVTTNVGNKDSQGKKKAFSFLIKRVR